MKTHSGAKKRFKLTASGKVRGRHPFTSHILEKKSAKRKRTLGAPALLSDDDTPRIKRMLGAPTKSARSAAKASRGASKSARDASAASRDAAAAPRGSRAAAKQGAGS
ncbi:MAG TPA: 50S ribosomal protein L35 [Solirubrobacteraceae bacterium]|nr:50S ribosomal protein L35 [Solirubrobacteraceae bacterium]